MKRTLALLIAVLMIFGMVSPVTVHAETSKSEMHFREARHGKKTAGIQTIVTAAEVEKESTDEILHSDEAVNGAGAPYTVLEEPEIWIEEDMTLTGNVLVAEGAAVFIAEGVTVTVPAGIELNIQGYVEVYGTLIVQPGGILTITDQYVRCLSIWTGKLDVTGADISGVPYGTVEIQRNSTAQIIGMPTEMLYASTYVFSTADVNEALKHTSEYYYFDILSASSFTLTNSITLPENTEWIHWKYQGDDTPDHTVIIPAGVTVTNNGWLTVESGTRMIFESGSVLVNNGMVWVSDYSTFMVMGTFQQNGSYTGQDYHPTMSQSDLEAELANCAATGNGWLHSRETTLDSDMTIDLGEQVLMLNRYGSIIVPSGVTLTINSDTLTFCELYGALEHGKIIVRNGGRLILNGIFLTREDAAEELILEEGSYLQVNSSLIANGSIEIGKDAVVEVNDAWIGYAPVNNGGKILPAVTGISVSAEQTELDLDAAEYVTLWVSVTPDTIKGATWTSSDPAIIDPAKIVDMGEGEYRAELGNKTGVVTLTATSIDGSQKTATIQLTLSRREQEATASVPMHRMYDPNSGEHFYTGAELERDFLVEAGWQYEGVGFNFPVEGDPVYRLYDPVHGEHLYTMDEAEMNKLLDEGWQYEGVAFNSAGTDEVPQYRLHNPNAKRGGYHFTGSDMERDILIEAGWEYQGIGWYSCLE